jgi:hypothetical protein
MISPVLVIWLPEEITCKNIEIKKKTQVEVSVSSEMIILDIRQLVFERIRLRNLLLWYFLPPSLAATQG